jgi:hypothetical protein
MQHYLLLSDPSSDILALHTSSACGILTLHTSLACGRLTLHTSLACGTLTLHTSSACGTLALHTSSARGTLTLHTSLVCGTLALHTSPLPLSGPLPYHTCALLLGFASMNSSGSFRDASWRDELRAKGQEAIRALDISFKRGVYAGESKSRLVYCQTHHSYISISHKYLKNLPRLADGLIRKQYSPYTFFASIYAAPAFGLG